MRYEGLLEATAQLLCDRDFAEIGLYDVAELAGVPPGSVYHFFPTKEAAFIALAERHLEELAEILNTPAPLAGMNGWQDVLGVRFQRAVDYFNGNPAFARIALSGSVISEIRRLDLRYIAEEAHTPLAWLGRHVMMPYIPDLDLKSAALVGVYDGVWAASYTRHGRIVEEYAREGFRAGIAYCRTFLPEVIPFREPAQPEPVEVPLPPRGTRKAVEAK